MSRNIKLNEILNDVIHTAIQAIVCDDELIKIQAVGDIVDALSSVIPAERSARCADPSEYHTPAAALDFAVDKMTPYILKRICDRHGLKKRMTQADYMTVSEGCPLKKFKGTKATRLVAVRKGLEGNADTLFEIFVNHETATAFIERDGEIIYEIRALGLSHRRCLNAAIHVLRSHLHENDGVHRRHRLSRQRRAGGLTPERELAATVARQIDADDIAEQIENA